MNQRKQFKMFKKPDIFKTCVLNAHKKSKYAFCLSTCFVFCAAAKTGLHFFVSGKYEIPVNGWLCSTCIVKSAKFGNGRKEG